MKKQVAGVLMALGMNASLGAQQADVLIRFDGGIGVQPVANVVQPPNADGTFANVSRNIVRKVVPAGPWRIEDLSGTVWTDGRIRVRGRGLLLAAGNRIGQNADQSVFATLICEAAEPFTERSTTLTGVALDPNGDFVIDDVLSPAPFDCPSPVLLIRAASNGTWFATGIRANAHD
jgi:hypothetical protein